MPLNKSFDMTVKINDLDFTEFAGLGEVKFSHNLDHTQVFPKIKLNLSKKVCQAYNSSPEDDVIISINDEYNRYKISDINVKKSNVEFLLVSVFEMLKEKSFLVIDESGQEVINPVLSSYVTGDTLNDANFETLLKMIVTLCTEQVLDIDYTKSGCRG